MPEQSDDRPCLEQLLALAHETVTRGGLRTRIRYAFTFYPQRVLALLERVADADAQLRRFEAGWEKDREALRDKWARAQEETAQERDRLARVRALPAKWRAMTPDVDNGWADELDEALGDPKPGSIAPPAPAPVSA